MMNRFAGQLSSSRKLYPAALGVVVTYGFLVLCRVSVPVAEAAQTSGAPSPPCGVAPARAGFEVASIKPNRSSGADPIVRPMSNGIRATSVTLVMLVQSAYIHTRFMDDLVAGAPSWANSDRFDIEARVDTGMANDLKKLSPDERKLKLDLMLQTLLSDRFKLAIHKKTKEGSAYQLIVGKNGVKLRPRTPIDLLEQMTTGMIRMTSGSITAQDVSMERLATALSAPLERPVIDRTGLTGRYDFTLEWTPDQAATLIAPTSEGNRQRNAPGDATGPSLLTALQEQLGLKLKPTKVPIEVLVIDHVEKPSDN